jgi:hypothetical protein
MELNMPAPAPGSSVSRDAIGTPGTHDCEPTLTDRQVLEFCQKGFLVLEGVVPDEINRRTLAFLDKNTSHEPSAILREDWFVEHVMCNPAAAGAVRSLLGANFHLPVLMSNHRGTCPYTYPGGWHVDGNYVFGPQLNYLQVFYYPQAVSLDMGPTELVAGSHHWRHQQRFMAHYGRIRGSYLSASPAGTIFITAYQIWHRRAVAVAPKGTLRHLLKYFYWRTVAPRRDWIVEPDFDLANADYEMHGHPAYCEQFKSAIDSSEMFYWLCGMHEKWQCLGGQSWPLPANRLAEPYGFPGNDRARELQASGAF